METGTTAWRRMLLPVGFALACVVLAILAWRSFGGSVPLEPQGYRATLQLPHASNVFPGGDVRMAGVTIGEIKEVERTGNHGRVTIELDADHAPLRSGATAILRTKTLLGEGYVELTPGPRSAPEIPDGGALAARRTRPQQRLDDVLQTFEPGTRTDLRNLFGGVAKAFGGRSQAFNDAVGDAAPTAASVREVVDVLAGQSRDLQQLIAGGGDVLSAVGDQQGTLQAAVDNGHRVLDATARRDRELAATVDALPPFLGSLTRASRTIGGATGELNAAVSSLRTVTPKLTPALREIDRAAPQFASLFEELPPTLAAGRRGLPALTRIMKAAARPFDEIHPTLRELIPFLELLGASRTSVVGTFGNVASVLNGTMVDAKGRVIHYGNGLPTIWNEIVGGWVKKLPSSRGNPYPKPDSATDIGTEGQLRSFDCRHQGNPLYLPPLGTGTPPCRVQGPWEFKGKTAYFPRLQPAPP